MLDVYIYKMNRWLVNSNWINIILTDKSILKILFLVNNNETSLIYNDQIIESVTTCFKNELFLKIENNQSEIRVLLNQRKILVNTQQKIENIQVSYWLDISIYKDGEFPYLFDREKRDRMVSKLGYDSQAVNQLDILINELEKNIEDLSKNEVEENIIEDKGEKDISKKIGDTQTNDVNITDTKKIENTLPIKKIINDYDDFDSFEYFRVPRKRIHLSFCITCMNRFEQIKKTIGRNLLDNFSLSGVIEFVIIDFGTLGLKEFVFAHFINYLRSGYLRYIRTNRLIHWHASIAKNTSHRLSRGRILVNLDCDNFTGKNCAYHIINLFKIKGTEIILHQWSGESKDGTYGRLSYLRDNFFSIGGYDESMLPMGYQDHDLIKRFSLKYGAKSYIAYHLIPDIKKRRLLNQQFSCAVINDKDKSVENTRYKSKICWEEMNEFNRQISEKNIRRGIFRVNRQNKFIGVNIKYE